MLTERQCSINSLLCVGLDPIVSKLPRKFLGGMTMPDPVARHGTLMRWACDVIDATAPYASMFKPQHAHWEAIPGGVHTLVAVVAYIHENHPDIPVFMDCKRGDIDRTQECYREAHFGIEGADGMNYNGYMGASTLKSLIDPKHPGRALVGLGRTSNPDAWKVQDRILKEGHTVWEEMVSLIQLWSRECGVLADAGIVMGAAHVDSDDPDKKRISSAHLSRAREIVGDSLWFLIPGIGAQGGFVEETVKTSFRGAGSIVINSASGIIFASAGDDYAQAAAHEAELLRDQIRNAGGDC